MSIVNWGILSTADIARKLTIPAILRAKNAELIAIASHSASGSASLQAKKFNIPKAYHSFEELLNDPSIDAVYIPLPNHLHAEWVKKAAEAGKHVLCEKPAALTVEDTKEMIEVCEKNNVLFMETFMYQYHPQNQRVRDIITTGEIGDVKLVRSHCSFFLDNKNGNFRLTTETGGGSLYDVGVYCIHTIRDILKQEPTHVYAKAIHKGNPVDISTTGIMEFDNGVKGVFDCSMDMAQHMSYEVVGTKGIIQVPRAYRPDLFNGEGIIQVISNDGEVRKEIIEGDEYKLAMEHISDCMLNQAEPRYDSKSTIHNMNTLEACFASIKSGTEVEVSRVD
ncbi:Gfo/Idh/MocA family oxidoreductase [Oceanobacillus caeni]|uniref:Oxidoreductase n=1 Tax=Oceanobacillus caeni TaxID=405946 RepID=A0ABR5MML4_9BACI|nr:MULTISPECIES: Gfo/Idh/MocA family oxidoreductase [Bacillaceae]KPH77887.1 oxidoreductase [Oceanobacillus caeni]MBU8789353.1 Gfo/Idh/MocA family oxidoreductase [Oceanobacillus caeni]MCR1832864.1 Gfo/Idh/MocA family oxidoreductase [Oceanobacillus caeni]MED4474014.1 Gfo/Idh/MocA family oxidoreductase [Oceanobacillus caeni]